MIDEELPRMHYGDSPEELYQPIEYIMGLGGKRIRPLLTLLSYQLFADDVESIVEQALAVELFHNFTLVHDDIMDNAPIRRGQPTVHEKWNRDIGILSGDVMLVRVYDYLAKSEKGDLREIIRHFNQAASEVCEGQQMDMNFETRMDVSEEEYIEMIRLKTAVLLGYALELGGLLAGNKVGSGHLKDFGTYIGIGFQLKDDLLDVFGEGDKVGKQVGGDIISKKKTFLTIRAMHLAKGNDLKELNRLFSPETKVKPEDAVKKVTEIYEKYNIKEETEKEMNDFFDKGFKSLKMVDGSLQGKALLKGLTEQLIHRES